VDLILLFKALIMGIVEGVTEFLPISSTGHLIVAGELMDFWTKDKADIFEVVIQLGAILAVCYQYRERIIKVFEGITNNADAQRFTGNVLVAFLPAAVIGLLTLKAIKHYLFHPEVVAATSILGAFVIFWIEKREHVVRITTMEQMRWQDALKIGFCQCLALIPGTSRSGATIMGSLYFGVDRKVATEFSFFLAIPVMFAATFLDLFKHRHDLVAADLPVFAVGFVVSFIVALLVIRALLKFISNHDFTGFAWYRLGFGALILILAATHMVNFSS
jgi:undecaprenyl-diphosphatase